MLSSITFSNIGSLTKSPLVTAPLPKAVEPPTVVPPEGGEVLLPGPPPLPPDVKGDVEEDESFEVEVENLDIRLEKYSSICECTVTEGEVNLSEGTVMYLQA